MGLVIIFPTLITEPSNDGFVNQITMINNAKGIYGSLLFIFLYLLSIFSGLI